MSVPRYYLPRGTYLLTRRCTQRMFLLKPCKAVTRAFKYCLAIASRKFHIATHAFNILSNHYHLVVSERSNKVRLPDFMRWLNHHMARLLNKHYKRKENFWSSEPYSAVLLVDKEAVLDKITYVLTNAVKHTLVEKPEQWPGLHCNVNLIGRQTFSAKRPDFFKNTTDFLATESFQLSIPPQLKSLGLKKYQSLVKELVEEKLKQLKQERKENNQKVLGREAVLTQHHYDRPRQQEDSNPKKRPVIACKDKTLRAKVLLQIRIFQDSYREAWKLWKARAKDVVFPYGTYLMRVHHGVRCASPHPLIH
jgi:putative transposase